MTATPTHHAGVDNLADALGGFVTADDQILTPTGDLVYCNAWGRVKLQRHGQVVLDLGAWHDVAGVVAAFEKAVAA